MPLIFYHIPRDSRILRQGGNRQVMQILQDQRYEPVTHATFHLRHGAGNSPVRMNRT